MEQKSVRKLPMPTYEYVCEKCGHEFEAVRSISAKPLLICPKELCARKKWGRGKVKKKISGGAGLLFKGSGFYITDYRSEKYKDAAKKDSAAPASAGTETKSAKAESKSAPAKTETKSPKK
jgi:putative FmdB family regulatory protein